MLWQGISRRINEKSMVERPESSKEVLVCQNRSCRKQGAAEVLAAFQRLPVTGVTVRGCSCLAECGSGPMVVVMPAQIWYSAVHPHEVPAVVEQHLQEGCPVVSMLYPKYHPSASQS